MVEQVAQHIYRIPVPLPGNPLKELNSYFIRGADRDLLIDVGFRQPECLEALTAGLSALGSEPERRDLLLTHLHSDHTGLANEAAGAGSRIAISRADLAYTRSTLSGKFSHTLRTRFLSEGFPPELVREVETRSPARIYALDRAGDNFYPLNDGDTIQVGDITLRTVCVPGHTPGNAMFWLEEQGIMFTGDHVLFDITPNITAWVGVEDSLGCYMQSLARSRDYPVRLALPGHRKPGDYAARIDALLAHHEQRIDETLRVVRETPGLCAYQIAARMKWRIRANSWADFPTQQKWFAVGECLSHLDYLRIRGKIACASEAGILCYHLLP